MAVIRHRILLGPILVERECYAVVPGTVIRIIYALPTVLITPRITTTLTLVFVVRVLYPSLLAKDLEVWIEEQ